MCVAGPCRDVVAQHDERFGAFACRDDIEYATDVAAIVAQCVAGARCVRQSDAMQMSLVPAAKMQSRDDFLAGVAALVDGDRVQSLQRQCWWQQLIQQLRRQPRPARAGRGASPTARRSSRGGTSR